MTRNSFLSRSPKILPLTPLRFGLLGLLGMSLFLGCAGRDSEPRGHQGIFGTFSAWRNPVYVNCENTFRNIDDRERCKRENETRIIEPLHGEILITEVRLDKTIRARLGSDGTYRVDLNPGNYEVCIRDNCSDPIEVRMNTYTAYSIQLPRDSVSTLSKPRDADSAQ